MNRTLSWLIAAAAIALLVYGAFATVRARKLDRDIAARDSVNGVLAAELEAQKQRVLVSEIRNQVLAGVADELSRAVADVKPRIEGIAQRVTVTGPAIMSEDDTTEYVMIERKNDPRPYRLPKFIMDDTELLLRSAFALDSAWRAERTARLFLVDTLLPDVRRQLVIADSLIASQRTAIELRDRKSHPRCGTKCKVLAGAAGGEGIRQIVRRWLH